MRLSNRIRVLEQNMSLSSAYLEDLSQRLVSLREVRSRDRGLLVPGRCSHGRLKDFYEEGPIVFSFQGG